MALNKSFLTTFGTTANYHKIFKVDIDAARGYIEFIVGVYTSKEAKDAGAQHIWTEYVRIPLDKLSFDPRDIFYPLLKEYSESYLVGATDNIDPNVTPHPPVFSIVE